MVLQLLSAHFANQIFCFFFLIRMGVEFQGTGFLKPHQPAVDFLNDSVVQEPAKL